MCAEPLWSIGVGIVFFFFNLILNGEALGISAGILGSGVVRGFWVFHCC